MFTGRKELSNHLRTDHIRTTGRSDSAKIHLGRQERLVNICEQFCEHDTNNSFDISSSELICSRVEEGIGKVLLCYPHSYHSREGLNKN